MRARVCQRGVGNREPPPDPALPRPNLRRSVSDLHGFKRSRGLDRICQAHRPSIHRQPGSTATSTSTRPPSFSISVSSLLDLTACARLGEGDRTKETQTLGSFGPIVCCIAVEFSFPRVYQCAPSVR